METITRPTEMGRKTILIILTDFPAFSADDSNVRSRRRSQFFREGVVGGASESGAPEPWFTSGKLSSTPLLYSPNNDAIGEPVAPRGGRRASA